MTENLETLTNVGIMVGLSVGIVATILSSAIGIIKVAERRYARDQLMPLYKEGKLDRKPTIFNAYRITQHTDTIESDYSSQ